jgi:hypothetical protein
MNRTQLFRTICHALFVGVGEDIPMRSVIPLLLLLVSVASLSSAAQILEDPGFESIPTGGLAASGKAKGWEVQKTGRDSIQEKLIVEGHDDASLAKSGKRCISLSIPENTVGFEFVTVGQRIHLKAECEYEASVWVRWPDGPETAPADTKPSPKTPSAIVSFWARDRDGTGHFSGRDDWLFDRKWRRLTFRFRPPHLDQPTLVYVSLLPNQKPAATTILLDDFQLEELGTSTGREERTGSILGDSDFSKQDVERISPPWHFANMGGAGIAAKIGKKDDERWISLTMDEKTSNFESAQMWQHIALQKDGRYRISCRMRWDNFDQESPQPIVNYGIFHEKSRTWYGPVDQVLKKTGDWHTYEFDHIPTSSGPWKLYVQLNGWGNFSNGVRVSVDDFKCVPINPKPK